MTRIAIASEPFLEVAENLLPHNRVTIYDPKTENSRRNLQWGSVIKIVNLIRRVAPVAIFEYIYLTG